MSRVWHEPKIQVCFCLALHLQLELEYLNLHWFDVLCGPNIQCTRLSD